MFLAIRLPVLFTTVWIIERLFTLGVALFLLRTHAMEESKLSWLTLLILLPWVGSICYLLWGRTPHAPSPTPKKGTSPHFEDDTFEKLARLCNARCSLPASLAQSVEYFCVGREMLPRFLNDLSNAKRSIYLEYYIIGKGVFWDATLTLLKKKAQRGVDVRIIYDDFGCSLTLPRNFAAELNRSGIKTYAFRRVRPLPSSSLNHRDHRKIAVIDGEIAYTGGINLADEYIGESIRFGHWKDTAIRLTGAPAQAFALVFSRLWNESFPQNAVVLPEPLKQGTIACIPFCDKPFDGEESAFRQAVLCLLANATHTFYLTTPYLLPDKMTASALTSAAQAGVDVRILIPHIPDKKAVFALTRDYARELARGGVRVQEYTPGFLHAKSIVCDGKYTCVSSYNFDFRSFYLQYECGAFVLDKALARRAEEDFLSAWEQSQPPPKRTVKNALFNPILRFLAPLM